MYDGWPGKDVFINLDVGLIEVADLNCWTAQVFGIGTMGPLASLGRENLSLRLIGAHVKGYGAASRLMQVRSTRSSIASRKWAVSSTSPSS